MFEPRPVRHRAHRRRCRTTATASAGSLTYAARHSSGGTAQHSPVTFAAAGIAAVGTVAAVMFGVHQVNSAAEQPVLHRTSARHGAAPSPSLFPGTTGPAAATTAAPSAPAPRAAVPATATAAADDSPVPAVAAAAYKRAARNAPCTVPWYLLAGVGKIETNHGRFGGAVTTAVGDTVPAIQGPPTYLGGARAQGPMQFMPATWSSWGRDGNADGARDPQNIYDATAAAAAYLCHSGPDLTVRAAAARAVFSYNHLDTYVTDVLAYADAYRTGKPVTGLVPVTGKSSAKPGPKPTTSSSKPAGPPAPAVHSSPRTAPAPVRTAPRAAALTHAATQPPSTARPTPTPTTTPPTATVAPTTQPETESS